MRHYKSVLVAVLLLSASCAFALAGDAKTPLKCNAEGKFKIVQFTDTHWDEKADKCRQTLAWINQTLDSEKPDLVIFTGDIITMKKSPLDGWKAITEPMVQRKIPWAAVFGNHDDEQHGIARRELLKQIAALPGSLTEPGPESLGATGNYILTVAGTTALPAATLYLLDSNAYPKLEVIRKYKGGPGKYGWFSFEQVQWFRDSSRKIREANAKAAERDAQTKTDNTKTEKDATAGKVASIGGAAENAAVNPTALAFFHIPLCEFDDSIYLKRIAGAKFEGAGVCHGTLNSGMFAAMLESGDVLGIFVGHDHNSDYAAELFGVCLAYGRRSGANAYSILPLGARVIELTDGRRGFDSWLVTVDGPIDRFHFPTPTTAKGKPDNNKHK
jgi:hypothetical protein